MKSDKTLIYRASILGDRGAFGQLVERYQSPIRRFLYNLTAGDSVCSKDLAQEAFIKAWLGIGSFRRDSEFSTWLFRIAYNTFYDHVRSQQRLRHLHQSYAENQATATGVDVYQRIDDKIDFLRRLECLSSDERVVMLLHFMEDKSVVTISEITEMPTGTVKSHLYRGRGKIEEEIRKKEEAKNE